MYRLKKDADLSFFPGIVLLQVCVGRNELILNFDRQVRVTILSDFAVISPGGESVVYQEPTRGAEKLFSLLHDSVVRAEATTDGGLLLVFQSGTSLDVRDTSDQYESFWIAHEGDEIVV